MAVDSAARFAIVTPSYYIDFERCRLLCESIERFVPSSVPHYVIIDRADGALFAPLWSARTRLVFKEDILRGRLRQVPFARRWWVGTRSPPVRGWIVQQIIKLLVHQVADEDVFVLVDSGSFFVRPWDPRSVVRDGQVPLFFARSQYFHDDEMTRRWHRIGARLLGFKPSPDYDIGYIDALVTWRRDNLVMLHDHVERVTGRPSFDAFTRLMTLSEYHVYGMYCESILGARSGHYPTSQTLSLGYWPEDALDAAGVRSLLDEKMAPEKVLLLINEKSGTPVAAVRQALSGVAPGRRAVG